jgi:hypothetical protein
MLPATQTMASNTNPVIVFPAAKPELKLTLSPFAADRAEARNASQEAQERHNLDQDHEALRDREANLRDYETRLRLWQAQIESSLQSPPLAQYAPPVALGRAPSLAPFEGDVALQAAWEKFHRARELLEAEQAHLRDDRLNLKETAALLKRHEVALTAREENLAQREAILAAAVAAQQAEPVKQPSAILRFTQSPFNLAKSVFGGKSASQE